MPLQLHSQNIVVTAKMFNPAIFGDIWLTTWGVVTKEELGENSERIQMPVLSKVATPEFDLTVMQERLQLSVSEDVAEPGRVFRQKLGRIVTTLPHTPFVAVGVNFQWRLSRDGDLREFARARFFRAGTAFAGAIDSPDARYGIVVIKEACGGRLRMRVSPGLGPDTNGDEHQLLVDFNFDYRVEGKGADGVESAVARWDEANAETRRILAAIEADD